ncbi:type VI secretion system baseplate subunit TssF [Rhizobium mayense]|uniref:Type VI secretion system baseplate subunit TssF n=1 Tax=Rhizobium mayense TaxID=1312184 RepID=A0ABT7JR54_9HYPH|nr:type VI secretion system baseplate subunit TssF [Rhizobium mayense]MDL2398821.1 type VI secretion system baseplate subunit TssF [Rhizobium mayense]
MSVNSYYRDELSYLREMGSLFAKANPRLSAYLAKEASDPDVERLLEGFSFLVGRLRQRLDAEMPELALTLLQLVWPHYLRPVPPITTVQFRFAEGASGASMKVPRGTQVQTKPLGGESVVFSTSYDLSVLPLDITGVDLDNRKNTARLTLNFERIAGNGLQAIAEAPLTIFFNSHRDAAVARQLYLFFMEKVQRVYFTPKGGEPVAVPVRIEPLGFSADEATLPYPQGSFDGFRVMQEYFSCPEKFMYARLHGLERFASQQTAGFSLSFDMTQRFPEASRLTTDQFALNTSPAVNLFSVEGQALMISHDRSEYPVRATGGFEKRSVHAVESVVGWVQGSGRRVDYEAFESFRHDPANEGTAKLYYRTQVRPAILGNGVDHYLSFVTRLDEIGRPETETVSMKLLCSNGPLALQHGIGSVNQPTSSTPPKLDFSNITPILGEVPPPLEDNILWTLIANLARNFASLIDVDALRTVVGAYDFRANADKQAAQQRDLLLQSFRSFERRGIDIMRRGRPTRAYELALTVSESQMGGEGEMYLFGTILDQFLKSYASINSLHRFSVRGLDTNTTYKWTPKWGEAATL